MTSVTATCGECGGRANVSAPEVTVNEYRETPERSTYSFTCPLCGRCSTKHASFDVLVLLASANGVRWNLSATPPPGPGRGSGPPLSVDDLIDFTMALESTPDHLILQLAGD